MPVPPVWSFLFFTMLITLGLDSQFTMVETITTAVMDQWPQTRAHKGKVVIGACALGFLLGLSCCSRGGIFMFSLIDSYASSWGLLICAVFEVILVMWVYGFDKFFKNIEEMGIKIPLVLKGYWGIMWVVITPCILLLVLILTFVQYGPAGAPSYTQDTYTFPKKIQAVGWLMAFAPVFFVLIGAGYNFFKKGVPAMGWLVAFIPTVVIMAIVGGIMRGVGGDELIGKNGVFYTSDELAAGMSFAAAPIAFIIVGAVYNLVTRFLLDHDDPAGLSRMFRPNDKWCSAVDDANKNRAGIANVSFVKDSESLKY